MTFQVNHLGHFLLTELLRDRLVASAPHASSCVASDAHKSARHGLDFDDLQSEHARTASFGVYGKTKLANILFTRELARRLDGTGVTANAVHPGLRRQPLRPRRRHRAARQARDAVAAARSRSARSRARRRRSTSRRDPSVEGITGGYWVKCAPVTPERRRPGRRRRPPALGRQRAARHRLITQLASVNTSVLTASD